MSTKFAIASSAASKRSPDSTTASEGSASITVLQLPTDSRPAKIVSGRDQTSAATRGSNCLPLRRRAMATAACVPPSRCATSTNSATCTTRATSGLSSPPSPCGQPCPSQRS